MDTVTNQKFIHRSPRKLRLLADLVRDMKPDQALSILKFIPQHGAKDLTFAIKVALANAKQKGLDREVLSFKTVEINEAGALKRYRPGTRGRAKPYKKRMSHIKIILSDEKGGK